MQFPAWSVGPTPEATVPNTVLDALASLPKPPKTIAIVTSKFPSVFFMSAGARQVAKSRGLQEVLFLEWEFGNRDFGPIASRVKDANPDFVWVGAIGLEGNQLLDAMKNIDYKPPLHFYMYPSPGPLAKSAEGKNALAASIFEEHAPFTDSPVAAEFVKLFHERAAKAGLPDTSVETQAAASYSAWQVLEAAVTATKSLDDKAISAWLKANRVKTIQGELRFDKLNNFGDDLMKGEAGPERPLGHRLAEGMRGAGRYAAGAVSLAPRTDAAANGPSRNEPSEREPARAVRAVGALHRRALRPHGPRARIVVGPAAHHQSCPFRVGVSRRVSLLSAGEHRRDGSARHTRADRSAVLRAGRGDALAARAISRVAAEFAARDLRADGDHRGRHPGGVDRGLPQARIGIRERASSRSACCSCPCRSS